MKSRAIVLLLLFSAPWVGGQAPAIATLRIEDPAGDAVNFAGMNADHIDIVSTTAELTESDLDLILEVADISVAALSGPVQVGEFSVHFTTGGQPFELRLIISALIPPLPDQVPYFWYLYRGADREQVVEEGRGDFVGNMAKATMVLRSLAAQDGTTPGPATPIQLLAISSHWQTVNRPGVDEPFRFQDTVDVLPGHLLLVPGTVAGAVAMATNDPIRFSNGEATTYHWAMIVDAPTDGVAEVEAEHEGPLTLRLPDTVHIEDGRGRFSLYATAPFVHDHGGSEEVEVTVDHPDGSAKMTVGIHYLDIPQPAGHHDLLFLQPPLTFGDVPIMNTLPWDGDEPIQGTAASCPDDDLPSGWGWPFRLHPSLRIGLDARTGESGLFETLFDVGRARLDGELLLSLRSIDDKREDNPFGFQIEDLDAATRIPVSGMENEWRISAELQIPPGFDRMRPDAYSNIGLDILYCPVVGTVADPFIELTGALTGTSLDIVPGGTLRLPLDEYHEPLPFDPEQSEISIVSDAVERRAPAGSEVAWNLRVAGGGQDTTVSLFGVDAELASLVGPSSFVATAQETVVPVVAVLPENAAPGQRFEIIAEARSYDGVDAAAIRLLAVVDPEAAPEAAGRAADPQEEATPVPALPILAGLLFLLVRRRL